MLFYLVLSFQQMVKLGRFGMVDGFGWETVDHIYKLSTTLVMHDILAILENSPVLYMGLYLFPP